MTLQKVQSELGRKAINEAKVLWAPYRQSISKLLEQSDPQDALLASTLTYAAAKNLKLLKLMNDLTVGLENVATHQAQVLRYVQTVGILLAVINFFIIVIHFIGQLRRGDNDLEHSRKETTQILETVNEGLFLLDKDLQLGSQRSAKLSEMFGGKNIDRIHFSDLIGDLVKPKVLETAERFVNLLFRKNIKDNLIKDLNPLEEVELNIPDQSGGYNTRYLSFDFSRAVTTDDTIMILVTVNDITKSMLLAKALESAKEKNEQQMETLSSILHTEPETLQRFINDALKSFNKINKILKTQGKSDGYMRRKLQDIFVEVHKFKGEASALELDNFAVIASDFEEDISKAQNKKKLNGNDFLGLAVDLEDLLSYTESVREISLKLARFAILHSQSSEIGADKNRSWEHLHTLSENVAEREGKQVELVLTGFKEIMLDEKKQHFIDDMSIQLIRNAIVHSIEKPEDRKLNGKRETGRLDLRLCQMPSGQLELHMHDDGQGIDYEKIRLQAQSLEKWQNEDLANWPHKKLLALIFEPGFSTAEQLSEDAGRGVGMDVIRSEVKKQQGRIKVASRAGVHCHFTISIPMPKSSRSHIAA